MIRYALKCEAGHGFESWFQSAAAFDSLARAGHLSCAVCGSTEVSKSLMAPRVTSGGSAPAAPEAARGGCGRPPEGAEALLGGRAPRRRRGAVRGPLAGSREAAAPGPRPPPGAKAHRGGPTIIIV